MDTGRGANWAAVGAHFPDVVVSSSSNESTRRREKEMTIEAPVADIAEDFSSPGYQRRCRGRTAEAHLREGGCVLARHRPSRRAGRTSFRCWPSGSTARSTSPPVIGDAEGEEPGDEQSGLRHDGSQRSQRGVRRRRGGSGYRSDRRRRAGPRGRGTAHRRSTGRGGASLSTHVHFYEADRPSKVFGFGRRDGRVGPPSGRGEMFNQTRWRFQALGEGSQR